MENNKIKICHIVNIIDGKEDGVFYHLTMLFSLLDRERFEQILIFQGGNMVESYLIHNKIKFYSVDNLNSSFPLFAFIKILKILKKEEIEIVHSHFLKPYVLSGIASAILGLKFIFNYHGLFIRNDYNSKIQQSIYHIFHKFILLIHPPDVVLTPSKKSVEILYNETTDFKNVQYYHNSYYNYEPDIFDESVKSRILSLKKDCFMIACVGRLAHEKNVSEAITIIKSLQEQNLNIRLVIIGSGPEEMKLKNLVSSLNLQLHVTFLGFLQKAHNYFDLFDLLLLTSKREAMPFVVWEAMAKKLPIISTDVGGIKEIIEKENCGFVYDSGDIKKAVRLIGYLYHDSSLRLQLSKNGWNAVTNKYTQEKFRLFFENLYSSLRTNE
ncbi:MAG: glycosyltransferase [Ignavibacteriaceae bacterium]